MQNLKQAAVGQGQFSLTFHGYLKGGAVTLVFRRHLTPVASSISSNHLDDLHFICVDLGKPDHKLDAGFCRSIIVSWTPINIVKFRPVFLEKQQKKYSVERNRQEAQFTQGRCCPGQTTFLGGKRKSTHHLDHSHSEA